MLIAELGINHHGSVQEAKRLIQAASEANCDAIKFQYRAENFYQRVEQIGDEIVNSEIERTRLGDHQIRELADFAKKLNLQVGVSFFRVEDFSVFSLHNHMDFYKVPSAEHSNVELSDVLLSTRRSVFLSTGGADLNRLPQILCNERVTKLNVMHCVANYPVALGQERLEFIDKLKEQNWLSVGYSSHDANFLSCLVAMGKGIQSLERHIVSDKADGGLDSSSSSDPIEFKVIGEFASRYIRFHRGTTAEPRHAETRNQGEILNMQNLGTGLFALEDMAEGTLATESNFEIKAPRLGISVGDFQNLKSIPFSKSIKKGDPLEVGHFHSNNQSSGIFELNTEYFHGNNIGLPVRLHDWESIRDTFPLNTFEFHLSFTEVLTGDLASIAKKVSQSGFYAIHLPDYISPSKLIDLFADDADVRNLSAKIISLVSEFADRIDQTTGQRTPVVGSFPYSSYGAASFVNDLGMRLDELGGGRIYPQWLPVHGWYFGGHAQIDTFNSAEYVDAVAKSQLGICLDVAHLIMSANFYEEDWMQWYDQLADNIRHVHISDAKGVDGEGLAFGDGDLGERRINVQSGNLSIVEVWQGHLNDFEGFRSALKFIDEKRIILN